MWTAVAAIAAAISAIAAMISVILTYRNHKPKYSVDIDTDQNPDISANVFYLNPDKASCSVLIGVNFINVSAQPVCIIGCELKHNGIGYIAFQKNEQLKYELPKAVTYEGNPIETVPFSFPLYIPPYSSIYGHILFQNMNVSNEYKINADISFISAHKVSLFRQKNVNNKRTFTIKNLPIFNCDIMSKK